MKRRNRQFVIIMVCLYIFIMIILGVFYYKNIVLYNSDIEDKSQYFLRESYSDEWSSLGENIKLTTNSYGMNTLETDYITVASKRNKTNKEIMYWGVTVVKQREPVYYEVKISERVKAATNHLEGTEYVYVFGDWSRLQYKKMYLNHVEDEFLNNEANFFGFTKEYVAGMFAENVDYYKNLLELMSNREYVLNRNNIIKGMVVSSVMICGMNLYIYIRFRLIKRNDAIF